jgi:hypothetical protein
VASYAEVVHNKGKASAELSGSKKDAGKGKAPMEGQGFGAGRPPPPQAPTSGFMADARRLG